MYTHKQNYYQARRRLFVWSKECFLEDEMKFIPREQAQKINNINDSTGAVTIDGKNDNADKNLVDSKKSLRNINIVIENKEKRKLKSALSTSKLSNLLLNDGTLSNNSDGKKVKKVVRFASVVQVCLVPCRKEMGGVIQSIWWQREDYEGMRASAEQEIRAHMSVYHSTPKDAMHVLYQPSAITPNSFCPSIFDHASNNIANTDHDVDNSTHTMTNNSKNNDLRVNTNANKSISNIIDTDSSNSSNDNYSSNISPASVSGQARIEIENEGNDMGNAKPNDSCNKHRKADIITGTPLVIQSIRHDDDIDKNKDKNNDVVNMRKSNRNMNDKDLFPRAISLSNLQMNVDNDEKDIKPEATGDIMWGVRWMPVTPKQNAFTVSDTASINVSKNACSKSNAG